MGYRTNVTGEFAITPPLTWGEIKNGPFTTAMALGKAVRLYMASAHDYDLALRVNEESVETTEGTLVRRTAAALVMREIDDYRERNLVEQVQEIIDAFPGHTFTGRLDCEGEENTDLWRVVVREGRALRVEPRIVWPDDEDGGRS
ncbi:hypothetical protein GTX53_24215 [Streptomyces sp. SID5594]|uniref:DUF6205 family protein n=1 Tax=unclassified Streptomyces TaxID=2593676 RepID=UPI00131A1187|nr:MULTISPECIES: DUF6205 family protein [unclassified Streptomyces]MZF56897.1 hypothetical protein [Streptomyces sp. SID5594]